MARVRVVVSGASIAGPAVAYWLARHGFEVTVVERAPALRPGGQAVDFRGEPHLWILEQMGVLDAIRAKQTHAGELTFVDADGMPVARLGADFAGGDLEVLRGDLSRILYEATLPGVSYRFGESIVAVDGKRVRFASGDEGELNVVIGADGLHSNVRRLVFGDEAQFVRHMGYYVSTFSADAALDREKPIYDVPRKAVCFNEPGKAACFGDGRGMLFFASAPLAYDRYDAGEQKRLVERAFSQSRWHVPTLLQHMRRADDFYFDSISQVRTPRWWRGRAVLLGDAGYGGTIGGMGSGMAIIGSYVLAGELATAPYPEDAFERYSKKLGAYARECQKGAADVGSFMAPKTRWGIGLRNLAFRAFDAVPGKGFMQRMAMKRATGIVLDRYVS